MSIFCANCQNCKVFKADNSRRVRCSKGHWKNPTGTLRTFKYHTVIFRQQEACADYDSMGEDDLKSYMSDLRENLLAEDDAPINKSRGKAALHVV